MAAGSLFKPVGRLDGFLPLALQKLQNGAHQRFAVRPDIKVRALNLISQQPVQLDTQLLEQHCHLGCKGDRPRSSQSGPNKRIKSLAAESGGEGGASSRTVGGELDPLVDGDAARVVLHVDVTAE